MIKRYIMHAKKTAFIVEHDFIMATYLADRVIVYEGQASVKATATAPQSLSVRLQPSARCCRACALLDVSNVSRDAVSRRPPPSRSRCRCVTFR